ncbi:tyrosine-protein phosphatase non-receptor type 21 isoform X2, partial [Clarias magur]
MGYLAVFPIMSGKRGFCPGSTGRLTDQRIIEDHMISHYKRLHSAKASVDCSVPKSMRCDVKYIDQKRREQIKKGERTQSVRSLSQRSLRLDGLASSSSRNVKPSARGAESAYFNSGCSSPRFSTSFNCKQIVYPSQMAARAQNCRPCSGLSYKRPESQRDHLCATSSSQTFKSFQDPTQKTYSGDILLKHAHCFTQEKPFSPRTLKTDCKSTLSTYRYYTPASRKGAEEKTPSIFNQPDTHHRSKRRSSTPHDSPQPCSVDHEWSDDESNVFGHFDTENKFKGNDFFLSSSRVSPEGMKSPIMRKVIEEEAELLYLEFIADVTNEIIQRGIYSDRVLQRVFERHIDMNKHRLDEIMYFSLWYFNKQNQQRWIDLEKPLKKQLDKYGQEPTVYFGVIFYVPTVSQLQQEITRYQYYLQLKKDVLEGRIPCSIEQAIRLAGLAVQADFGDFSRYDSQDFLQKFVLLPMEWIQDERVVEEATQKVALLYQSYRGMPVPEAEVLYIQEVEKMEGYGQESFHAKDSQGADIIIGSCLDGIFVKHKNGRAPLLFRWNDINNMTHNKSFFALELANKEDTIQFQTEDMETSKYVCRMCLARHRFYKINTNTL